MDRLPVYHEKVQALPLPRGDVLLAQKEQIRALKRILIAKAEVRRLKSLIGRHRATAR